jgi:hypothetical protein
VRRACFAVNHVSLLLLERAGALSSTDGTISQPDLGVVLHLVSHPFPIILFPRNRKREAEVTACTRLSPRAVDEWRWGSHEDCFPEALFSHSSFPSITLTGKGDPRRMTTSTTNTFDYGKLAYDRTEIAETLYRYAAGLDLGDADVLASSFTEDVVFDFTPAASKAEVEFPVLSSRDVVVKNLIAVLGPLDTSHSVSNGQRR